MAGEMFEDLMHENHDRVVAFKKNPDLRKVMVYMYLLAEMYAAKHSIKLEDVDIENPTMDPHSERILFTFCHIPPPVSSNLLDAYGNPARLN